jgi:hypothetical protein
MKQIQKKNLQPSLESRECTIVEVCHKWHEPSDRWIYLEYHEDGWIGLNFMQGDEYELFKDEYCVEDKELSTFYHEMINDDLPFHFHEEAVRDIEFIDEIIWIFYKAKASIFNLSNI